MHKSDEADHEIILGESRLPQVTDLKMAMQCNFAKTGSQPKI